VLTFKSAFTRAHRPPRGLDLELVAKRLQLLHVHQLEGLDQRVVGLVRVQHARRGEAAGDLQEADGRRDGHRPGHRHVGAEEEQDREARDDVEGGGGDPSVPTGALRPAGRLDQVRHAVGRERDRQEDDEGASGQHGRGDQERGHQQRHGAVPPRREALGGRGPAQAVQPLEGGGHHQGHADRGLGGGGRTEWGHEREARQRGRHRSHTAPPGDLAPVQHRPW